MAIRTVIVDDEPLARERLSGLLACCADVTIVGQCGDGKSAVRLIAKEAPDLVLLDIQLPEADGFEVLEAVPRERWPAVVFVTAYDRFAVRAFEVHAMDYLLKPVEPERLREALCRVRNRRDSGAGLDTKARLMQFMQSLQPSGGSSRILVKSDDDILCLRPGEIDWVESAGNHACFHIGEQTRMTRETLNAIESRLEKHNFVRVHRTAIVNLGRIRRLKQLLYGDGEIELQDGTKLPMSRSYRQAVMKRLREL